MTRIVCVSDLHENLPDIPECDLLLISGDLTFGFKGDLGSQQRWLINKFRPWAQEQPADSVVVVAGNHDQCVQQYGWPTQHSWDGIHYLEDSGISQHGLYIWGTPWQPWFYSWAFNAPQSHGEEFLADKFSKIPLNTDIIICHGPPKGAGDQVGDPFAADRSGQPRVGSTALRAAIERVQPRLMVCGHIHSGYGHYKIGATEVVNAAIVDNEYQAVNPLVVIDL